MLDLLSIFGVLSAFLIGYQFPRKAGWGVILIAPLLGPATFTFVSSSFLPLTTYRIAFAITMGVILRNHNQHGIPLSSIFKSTLVKIVVVFSLFVILISLGDRSKNIIFTYIPNLILAFALCYILIRGEKDLQKLVKIFVWQGAIISVFIMLEYFTDFDINIILMKTIPGYDFSSLQSKHLLSEARIEGMTRAGITRAMGIDGNAVATSYRLTFLFPLALWYMIRRKGVINKLPVSLVLVAFFLLQTRASFVGIIISFIMLLVLLLISNTKSVTQKMRSILKPISLLVILGVVFVLIYPDAIKWSKYNYESFMSSFDSSSKEYIGGKISRIPRAIDLFLKKPFIGYLVSPYYSYSILMYYNDLPSPFIYLLSGGIILLIIFLLMVFFMPYSTFKLSKIRDLHLHQREFLIYACSAFVGGIVVVFSNRQEAHFLIMYMLYISIYKVFQFRQHS